MNVLKKRADFLRLSALKQSWVTESFILQVAKQLEEADHQDRPFRVGFTVSRRVGNAVKRNFCKRRLREAVRHVFPEKAHAGNDYVLIARTSLSDIPFDKLIKDLEWALRKSHDKYQL